ncbi:hypothetical protein FB451DRAFT_1196552 [Mycena latifolia]|nr:hypothetical protein FB451DRAFT_1196552 [Mycena latifolia]
MAKWMVTSLGICGCKGMLCLLRTAVRIKSAPCPLLPPAIIAWDPDADRTAASREDSGSEGAWALIRHALSSPSPGQTLGQVYTSLGKVLGTQANRAAHDLGLDPHAVSEKIKSYFGDAGQRLEKLLLLCISIELKLEKWCQRLMKYALP